MVVAEGVGDECRQAARPTEGHCRIGPSAGGDHASHVARRHRVPLDTTRHHAEGRLIVRPTIAACRRARGPSRASRCAMGPWPLTTHLRAGGQRKEGRDEEMVASSRTRR